MAAPDECADAALFQGLENFFEALEHEGVVAFGGFGIIGHQAEDDGDGQAESIGALHGIFEGVGPFCALALLHLIQKNPLRADLSLSL